MEYLVHILYVWIFIWVRQWVFIGPCFGLLLFIFSLFFPRVCARWQSYLYVAMCWINLFLILPSLTYCVHLNLTGLVVEESVYCILNSLMLVFLQIYKYVLHPWIQLSMCFILNWSLICFITSTVRANSKNESEYILFCIWIIYTFTVLSFLNWIYFCE